MKVKIKWLEYGIKKSLLLVTLKSVYSLYFLAKSKHPGAAPVKIDSIKRNIPNTNRIGNIIVLSMILTNFIGKKE